MTDNFGENIHGKDCAMGAGTDQPLSQVDQGAEPAVDMVAEMARHATSIISKVRAVEIAASQAGRETIAGDHFADVGRRHSAALEAVERFIAYSDCQSIEGAVAQILHAASWANQCIGDDDYADDFQRLERLTRSALFFLADKLKIDLNQLGGEYYVLKDRKLPDLNVSVPDSLVVPMEGGHHG